jgi:hypothetical protein
MMDSFLRVEISFQEMTLSFQSPGHEQAVHAALKSTEHITVVQFAGAGQADDHDIGRIG